MTDPIAALPKVIERQVEGDRVRYVLPLRDLGKARWAGLMGVVFSLGFVAFTLYWIAGAAGLFAGKLVPAQLPFAAFGLLFLWPSWLALRVSILVFRPSRSEIDITPKRLVLRDVAGIVSITRRVSRRKIVSLTVGNASSEASDVPAAFAGMGAITISVGPRKRKIAAAGYPLELLAPLAEAIAHDCGSERPILAGEPGAAIANQAERKAPLVLHETSGGPVTSDGKSVRPPGCAIEIAALGDSTTVSIPPAGFRGTNGFLLVFCVVWLAFTTLITGFMVFALIAGKDHGPGAALGPVAMLPFWAVGVFLMLVSIQRARRRSVLVISPDSVVLSQVGPLRKSEKTWPRSEVVDARVGPSGESVNDVPLMQVQLIRKGGKKHVGLCTGLPGPELSWLAGQLRRALRGEAVPARA